MINTIYNDLEMVGSAIVKIEGIKIVVKQEYPRYIEGEDWINNT